MKERLLIVGTNWIGDSVMSLAAVRELRRLFPESHLAILARPWVAGIFESQGILDEVLVPAENSGFAGDLLNTAGRLKGFHRAFLFPNSFRAALTAFLARVPARFGYRTDGRGLLLTHKARPRILRLKRHQIYYYLDLLYQTGISSRDYLKDSGFQPDIGLKATEEGLRSARRVLEDAGLPPGRPLVVLNPGAHYGPAKRWPSERYARLADRLISEANVSVVIIGSRSEEPVARSISKFMTGCPLVLTGKTNLITLIGLLSLSRLLVTNDSGPMHLAAALDTPQISLFGSTDETATGPFSRRAEVIHKHVECSPCLLRECPIDLRCFTRIEVDEVYESAREALNDV